MTETKVCLRRMGSMPGELKALVFDLDGTLADTEGLYRRFWVEAANLLGFPMEDRHALMIRSMGAAFAEPLLQREVCPEFDYTAVRALRRKIMGEWIDEHGVAPKDGCLRILREAKNAGLLVALATATPLERARQTLERMGALPYMDALACGDMVEKGKPEPDLYLLALKKLGVEAAHAIGVEDSPSGIRSARAAGLTTVLIPDQDEPSEELLPLCDFVLPSLHVLCDVLAGT